MPSAPYDTARFHLVTGSAAPIDWENDLIKWLAVTSAYTFDETHADLTDITGELTGGGYLRATAIGKSRVESGNKVTFDCADPVFPALDISAGVPAALVCFYDDGADGVLLAYIELDSARDPTGGSYVVRLPGDGVIEFSVGQTEYTLVDLASFLAAHTGTPDWAGANINSGARVVSGSDVTLSAVNAGVSHGNANGTGFILGTFAEVFGIAWKNDGSQGVGLVMEEVAYSTDEAVYNGLGIADGGGDPTGGNGRSHAIQRIRWGGVHQFQYMSPTGAQYLRAIANVPRKLIALWTPTGVYGTAALGAFDVREAKATSQGASSSGSVGNTVDPTSGGLGLFVVIGRNNAVAGAITTGSFRISAQLFDRPLAEV